MRHILKRVSLEEEKNSIVLKVTKLYSVSTNFFP